MAEPEKKQKKTSTKPTMRDLANSKRTSKKRTLKSRSSTIAKPFKRLRPKSNKRLRLIRLPNNRFGRILDKVLFIVPRYFKGAWGEIRQTTWPNRRETIRLTFAVFIFSSVFAAIVAILDFALDKIFKSLITK